MRALAHVAGVQDKQKKPRRRRRLRTPAHVIRAIEEITHELAEGTIDPAPARARLYALQTLLVALRMTHPAQEGKPRRELPPILDAE